MAVQSFSDGATLKSLVTDSSSLTDVQSCAQLVSRLADSLCKQTLSLQTSQKFKSNPFVLKAHSYASQATSRLHTYESKKDYSEFQQALVLLIQSLLDFTFIFESIIVELDFPSSKLDEFQEVVSVLSGAESLAISFVRLHSTNDSENKTGEHSNVNSNTPISDEKVLLEALVSLLGAEILECLHWRRGALFYMYIATMVRNNRINEISIP